MHNDIDMITLQAPVSTTVEQYLLQVTVNGSSSFNTTVPANTTSASIFEVFPNIVQRRYTTYSLRVASISDVGQSYFTDPVSIGSKYCTYMYVYSFSFERVCERSTFY